MKKKYQKYKLKYTNLKGGSSYYIFKKDNKVLYHANDKLLYHDDNGNYINTCVFIKENDNYYTYPVNFFDKSKMYLGCVDGNFSLSDKPQKVECDGMPVTSFYHAKVHNVEFYDGKSSVLFKALEVCNGHFIFRNADGYFNNGSAYNLINKKFYLDGELIKINSLTKACFKMNRICCYFTGDAGLFDGHNKNMIFKYGENDNKVMYINKSPDDNIFPDNFYMVLLSDKKYIFYDVDEIYDFVKTKKQFMILDDSIDCFGKIGFDYDLVVDFNDNYTGFLAKAGLNKDYITTTKKKNIVILCLILTTDRIYDEYKTFMFKTNIEIDSYKEKYIVVFTNVSGFRLSSFLEFDGCFVINIYKINEESAGLRSLLSR